MKRFKQFVAELNVPAGTTGKRANVKVDYVTVVRADGKTVRVPAGKSASSRREEEE